MELFYRQKEGYRYVRQYWTKQGKENYALFERIDGKRRRVGTARSEEEYTRFLERRDNAY